MSTISEAMVRYYLDTLTVGYFNDHDLPPENLSGYDSRIEAIKLKMKKHGDEESLRFALAFLLSSKQVNLAALCGERYAFDTEEMREIIGYINEKLFSGTASPTEEELASIEFVDMPLEQWWERSSDQGSSG